MAKKKGQKKGHKKKGHGVPNPGNIIVNRGSAKNHKAFPMHYLTWQTLTVSGFQNAAVASISAFIAENSILNPLDTTSIINNVVGAGALTTTTLKLSDQTDLSGLYFYYKVRKLNLKIKFYPTTSVPVHVCIYPTNNPGAASTLAIAAAQPYSVSKLISTYNDIKDNTITIKMDSYKILGYSKRQFEDQVPTQVTANPSSSTQWFYICTMYDGAGNTFTVDPVHMEITLDAQVEYFQKALATDV